MKTLNMSVLLLMFALIVLGVTGCTTNNVESTGTIPWDRPDVVLDSGNMPMTGAWRH
ncbi:MAG: hypothetical protein ACXWKG_13475 [Limisphaerales bacterium]